MHENTQYRLYIGESCRTRGNTPQCGNFLNGRDFSQLREILHQPSFQVISYLALWYDPVYINISIQIYFPVYRNISVPGHYPVPPPHDWKRFSWNARKLSNWCFQSTIYFVLHSLNWIFHSFSVSDISSVDNKKAFFSKTDEDGILRFCLMRFICYEVRNSVFDPVLSEYICHPTFTPHPFLKKF